MNDRFFLLPAEKQRQIVNAAQKVFSQNAYKKASMSEIAGESGVSKALLFHYFKNKKEFYLYLWQFSVNIVFEALKKFDTIETQDFFEMLRRSLFAKCSVMRNHPCLFDFLLKAYYEQEPDIQQSIHNQYVDVSKRCEDRIFERIDTTGFRADIDLKIMYKEIIMAIEGYMFHKYHAGTIDPDEIEKDITILLAHWRTVYCVSSATEGGTGWKKR
ncbi:MAG: TetR/AcrR family transcriptional regulator [Eubacteriales bacterium]|nr:TetR/AcrR family transcriptional regulator [Eubacteriales bacterium]